ncbi:E set domain-containing protein [Hesseltinella vesiculosa]|uniref:Rho GDP-dissociation inhibitor n=1 Tax=Hesseltinella vesiculosa TaxID=101127 RepID=A0A1X2GGA8_9FUNG|nr:E set domain-containing protein [Hesseltinella vesiculosa]
MSQQHDEDLTPTQTAGYIPGQKKSLAEYNQLDAEDESLRKWKESLGLAGGAAPAGPTNDSRRVVVEQIALEVAGRPDVVVDLSTPGKLFTDIFFFMTTAALENAKKSPFIIKEGVEYRMKVKFRVQHDVVSGLKYLQVVKRGGIRVDKMEEMIGSYGPQGTAYEKRFQLEEAPSGMLARGHYEAKSKFVDDDNETHMEWAWSFDIKKDW